MSLPIKYLLHIQLHVIIEVWFVALGIESEYNDFFVSPTKEAIVEHLNNKLSVEDARKCSVFKFNSARQRDIASFEIIAPAAFLNVLRRQSFDHKIFLLKNLYAGKRLMSWKYYTRMFVVLIRNDAMRL